MINRQIINTFVAIEVLIYLFLIAMYSEILTIYTIFSRYASEISWLTVYLVFINFSEWAFLGFINSQEIEAE